MAPHVHRKIRKWLYNPIYNRKLLAKYHKEAYKLLTEITTKD
jgi:hypothetical protein